tara:strand:+ start:27 stop:422 length:396 start_codon:yes stop_codon:yes gene_type:complete
MRKSLSAILISLLAVSYAADITPTISLRVGDMINDGLAFASPVIGLNISGSANATTGFDANATSSRIYIERSYGKVGLGTYTLGADAGIPYFTIGTSYNAYGNLNVELEYVMNSLAAVTPDALQLSLTVGF